MSEDRKALADALDYFRPHRLTGDGATILLTAGKMREALAVIEAALAEQAAKPLPDDGDADVYI